MREPWRDCGTKIVREPLTGAALALAGMAGSGTKSGALALTAIPAGGVVLTFAVFNVAGWGVRWHDSWPIALLFCGLAFFSEFLGFALAIAAEKQWQAGKKRRVIVCIYSLMVCAFVNVVSGDNSWTTFETMMTAPQMRSEQTSIDRERRDYLGQIAAIDQQLESARPAPSATIGPQARAEARQVYELEIARLSPARTRLQARLDAMPIVAEERHIIAPWAVWAGFIAIEVMKALVLWGIGLGDIGARVRSVVAGAALSAQTPGHIAPPTERGEIIDTAIDLSLAQARGRALLDELVKSNVVSMTDVASKHAARPRPGRRKAA